MINENHGDSGNHDKENPENDNRETRKKKAL